MAIIRSFILHAPATNTGHHIALTGARLLGIVALA